MAVENLSAAPMDLMYLCHVNFAFAEGARIVQPVPFDPEHVVTRTAIPGHVTPTHDYRALLAELAADPRRMERLDEPQRYDPEQVFYIKGLEARRRRARRISCWRDREGDGFTIAYDPDRDAAHDPLGAGQQRPARRRLRDAGDLRARGLSRPRSARAMCARSRAARRRSFDTAIGYVDAAEAAGAGAAHRTRDPRRA